jgi:signal transduction histidine kinase
VDALSVNMKRSLSAIFELARTLSTDQESKDDERLLYQLMTQAKRMEHAIRDIFDADRLTRGELVLERRSTEIDTLVRRVVREFPFAGDRDLDIAVEPARIMVDRVRVERLVDDLLTSAVGRTETGDRIALVLERAPDGVLISVEGGTPLNGDGTAGAARRSSPSSTEVGPRPSGCRTGRAWSGRSYPAVGTPARRMAPIPRPP